jgi:hypothetical protein
MLRQRHETLLDRPMTETFCVLVSVVAKGRWTRKLHLGPAEELPKAGSSYEQQRGSVLRRGRVLECIKPVSITLHETLFDPPCCVKLKLRWRLEPVESGSFLRLDTSFDLNGAASLRRRHWNSRIDGHCGRMIASLRSSLEALHVEDDQEAGISGQNTGSSSMTATKISRVNGRPTLRKSVKR